MSTITYTELKFNDVYFTNRVVDEVLSKLPIEIKRKKRGAAVSILIPSDQYMTAEKDIHSGIESFNTTITTTILEQIDNRIPSIPLTTGEKRVVESNSIIVTECISRYSSYHNIEIDIRSPYTVITELTDDVLQSLQRIIL